MKRCFSSARILSLKSMNKSRNENNFTFSTRFPRKPAFSRVKSTKKKSPLGPKIHPKVGSLPIHLKLAPLSPDKSDLNTSGKLKSQMPFRPVTGIDPNQKFVLETPRILTYTYETGHSLSQKSLLKSVSQHGNNENINSEINEINGEKNEIHVKTMSRFGMHNDVVKALSLGLGISTPNHVQSLAIPVLMNPLQDVFLGAETGSGKTISYLAPVMNSIHSQDMGLIHNHALLPPSSRIGKSPLERPLLRPRAIILVSSRDLVLQVTKIAKLMSHYAKMRVCGIHGKMARHDVRKVLDRPVDLLVTTPGALAWLMSTDKSERREGDEIRKGFGMKMNHVQWCVIDECDVTMDDKHGDVVRECLKNVFERREAWYTSHAQRKTEKEHVPIVTSIPFCQMILVSATLPINISNMITSHFPKMVKITSKHMHKTPATLSHSFYRINSSITKNQQLVEILKRSIMGGDKRVFVFVNRVINVGLVSNYLTEKGFDAFGAYAGGRDSHVLKEKMSEFLMMPPNETSESSSEKSEPIQNDMNEEIKTVPIKNDMNEEIKTVGTVAVSDKTEVTEKKSRNSGPRSYNPSPMICVTTDINSRGIDSSSVNHVILYDFPVCVIDYLHRAGRTARNGQYGKVSSIVTKGDVALAEVCEAESKAKR